MTHRGSIKEAGRDRVRERKREREGVREAEIYGGERVSCVLRGLTRTVGNNNL